ncbi:YbgA family protein [Clostridium cylindrosporum]|uniref:DUF1722 domain-containing protein n=1 Tax=Clostridium cylindrosporum DSM 605 TaxID=1121307 RepID=A0A0J8G2P5_CLOCY|nr:DUF523 and DUF1722 domain-containing protein [Clostridium cylindrosporum]KMT21991.1 hypothetical protein CLCY_3c02620 [Clostridium cylindrosporum DSM 605]
MRVFKKPTILISNCIENEACRYNGAVAKSPFVNKLKPYVNFVLVCPEVAVGLPIPREALRIISNDNGKRIVFSKSGEDLTDKVNEFSDKFIEELSSDEIHGAILKSRSPSCGVRDVKVYNNHGKSASVVEKGRGLFADKIVTRFNQVPIEDEGRLTNYNIREHFLTKIFTFVDFREIKKRKCIESLIGFQSENKYLLMAHSPGNQKKLGQIIGDHKKIDIDDLFNEYEHYLHKALSIAPTTMRNINMLLHLFGYFSNELSQEEKAFFLDSLENYRTKKVPFSVPLAIVHSWVIRFQNEYLLSQTIFETFPGDLVDVTDSGKGV